MKDNYGRTIDYMRISVTDRCNLRCRYCMPEEGTDLMTHEEILTFEEIERLCRLGVSLGIRKLKLTGGEPLVRKGLPDLAAGLCAISGIEDVTVTTNGCLLSEQAGALKAAGISGVNVSLDTLDRKRFAFVTRRDRFDEVMEGIRAAKECGLKVKINCAVMESLAEQEVLAFAAFSAEKGIPVRFIEMMPIGEGCHYKALDNDELLSILRKRYVDIEKTEEVLGNGPASYYRFGTQGYIGFFSAVHHKFCSGCNRVRLTSDGYLKLCLACEDGVSLRDLMRGGISDEELAEVMKRTIERKPLSHHFEERGSGAKNMNQIGG